MTEREKFLASFRHQQQAGLADVKFYVLRTPQMTVEDFYAAANHMDDAIAKGKCREHRKFNEAVARRDISGMLER